MCDGEFLDQETVMTDDHEDNSSQSAFSSLVVVMDTNKKISKNPKISKGGVFSTISTPYCNMIIFAEEGRKTVSREGMDDDEDDCLASLRNKNQEEVRQCLVLDQELLNRGLSRLGHQFPQVFNSSHFVVENKKHYQRMCRRTVQLGGCAIPLSITLMVTSKTFPGLENNARVVNVDFGEIAVLQLGFSG